MIKNLLSLISLKISYKKIFLLPIETCSREYYKLDFGEQLKDKNSFVIITNVRTAHLIGFLLKKINWVGQNLNHKIFLSKRSISKDLYRNNSKIFLLDEEGGIFPEKYALSQWDGRIKNLEPNNQTFIFSWGKMQHEYCLENNFVSFNVGHPRFFDKNSSLIMDKKLCSNSLLIMTSSTLLFRKIDKQKNYYLKTNQTKKYLDYLLSHSQKFISLVDLLSNNLEKDKIYIRLHPSENEDYYKLLFPKNSFPNLSIIKNEKLETSLSRSKNIFHFNCTTSLDAYCYGIRTKNLSKEKYTVIEDLYNDNLENSIWLTYPCRTDKILDEIRKNSISKKVRPIILFTSIVSITIFEILLSLIKPSSYNKSKRGTFMPKKNKFRFFDTQIF